MGTIWHLLQIQGLDPNQILSRANVITRVKNGRGKVSRLVGLVQPLEFRDFPHQATGRATKIPATIENFTYLMEMHGVDIRYNLVTKKTTVVIPHLKTTIDNADNVKLAHINSLCQLNNLSVGNVEKLCGAIADQNVFSPVEEWISSKQWDGVDRLDDFYSTLVADEEFPEEFKKTLMKRWMISAVAAVYMPKGFHCRGVLTLSGKQGLGKTSWIKSLVNDPDLCREVVLTGHCLDANNRDSQSTAIRNWLVELGELESTLRKDLPVLKSFITKDMDTFRKPYAECDSTFPRRTVFFASVNDANFLNDSTGNSRWWVIPVVEVNHLHGVDMQQVFAQVKEQLYDRGEAWWLSSVEEAQLTELNKDAEVISPVKELVITYLNEAMGVSTEFLTATSLLKRVGVERSTMGQCKEVSAVLTEKFGKKRKTSGNWGWDVPVRGGHCS
jgi:putative DNA primase/helicase